MTPSTDGISSMLSSYQEIVRYLLCQDEYSGVSAQDLDLFKSQFRASAYTCRLSSCPHATLGFETQQACTEHEISHIRRWACDFPGCQYPPFVSKSALSGHKKKHHSPQIQRRSIRRPTMSQIGVPRTIAVDANSKQDLRAGGSSSISPLESNPPLSSNLLTDFDFDSFLHDDDQDPPQRTLNFNSSELGLEWGDGPQ